MVRLRVPSGIALSLALAALPSPSAAADPRCDAKHPCAVVTGRVKRAGDRVPIAEVQVLVATPGDPPAWTIATQTDAQGRFEVAAPLGAIRLVVMQPGFERYDVVISAEERPNTNTVAVALRPDGSDAYRTVVDIQQSSTRVGVSPRHLDREEIATLPGTQGDSLRALQSLPGVGRTPGGLGLLILRGASPNQSALFVGEHRVPRAFHALAISSVVPSDVLEDVEYVPGNYSSRYGNGSGGLVVLRPRSGRRDGVHGHGEVDLGGAGARIEGPVGKGAMLAAVQRSYVDGYLRLVEAILPEAFVLPAAWDYQFFADHPIGRGSTFAIRVLGSEDRVRSRYLQGDERLTLSEFNAGFHRADVELRHRTSRWRFLLTPSFRFEYQRTDNVMFGGESRRRDFISSGRAEAEAQLSRRAAITVGADTEIDPYATVVDGNGPGREESDGLQTSNGLYVLADIRLGPVTLVPGMRLNAYTHDSAAKVSTDPRLLGCLTASEKWSWTAGVGLYSEPEVVATQQQTRFVGDTLGNVADFATQWQLPAAAADLSPSLTLAPAAGIRVAQALQVSTSVAYLPAEAWAFEAGAFLRRREESAGPSDFTGDGLIFRPRTRNYGFEVLLRKRNVGRLYGWLSYTLSWARQDELEAPFETYTDSFDQRHNLAVVASYSLPRRWRIGGRFRLVSGVPYTPIVGVLDIPGGPSLTKTLPLYGSPNTARFPLFHQLDLRVDKRWYARRVIITLYLDVQNVYNHQNVELYRYSPDYRRREASLGLPIFPSIGVRIDY